MAVSSPAILQTCLKIHKGLPMPNQTPEENPFKADLMSLRPILEHSGKPALIGLFDEFIENSESELALFCVCDYLLEPETAPPNVSTLDLIVTLQTEMKIQDKYLVLLLAKTHPGRDLSPGHN